MDEFFKILATGLIAGIVSPILLSFLQQRIVWRVQKQIEIKTKAFDEAMQALAMYEADALDVEFQANKPSGVGVQPRTHFRQETIHQIQKSLALIEAFFNEETFIAFSEALSSGVTLETIPNERHSERRTKAIRLMADELGLSRPWWQIWNGK